MTPHPAGDLPAMLAAQRAELLAELDDAAAALLAVRRLRADRSDDDEHDPEGAPLSGEWTRLEARHRSARQRVREADAALAELATGRYGICRRCGEPIAPGRLAVRPTATQCVHCAASDRP